MRTGINCLADVATVSGDVIRPAAGREFQRTAVWTGKSLEPSTAVVVVVVVVFFFPYNKSWTALTSIFRWHI